MAKGAYIGIPTPMTVPTGKCKYANMELPTLPEWDKDTYPYAYISYSSLEGYKLRVFTEKLQYVLSQGKCTPETDAQYIQATVWDKDEETWSSWSTVRSATSGSTYVTAPLWANVAVPYSDNSATLLQPSEPTVQYEDRIIDVARKIKNGYIGIDSVARKIKKAYIGIGGVARPCLSSSPVENYGQITPLDFLGAGDTFVGVSAGDYAIFAGGNSVAAHHYFVNAYDADLTKTVAPNLNNEREDFAGAYISTDKYTLFAGGTDDDGNVIAAVDAYDASLTHINVADMEVPREQMASASVGKYAIFAGGLDVEGSRSGDVEYFYRGTSQISNNTMNSSYDLQIRSKDIVGGTNGTLAIFYTWYSSTDRIDAYNSSLTYSKVTDVGVVRDNRSIARAGDYAIVAGGLANNLPCADMNIALNQSLTITPVDDIQEARYFIPSTSLGQYAVFAGGHLTRGASGSSKVDLYDASLTHTIAADITTGVHDHAVASVGNYALIAGGNRNGNNYAYSDIVEAFILSE